MHTPARTIRTGPRGAQSLRHRLTILVVIAQAEFKLKYAGSALGYVWSVLKPLALFTMLYLVFGRIFKLGTISQYYPSRFSSGSCCSRSSPTRRSWG